jgi:excisionase family DNA binding protein
VGYSQIVRYLTTSEAAKQLGVSRRRVSIFIKTGRLKATPLGTSHRAPRFLKSGQQVPGPQPSAWMIAEKDLERFASLPRPMGGAGIKALRTA